MPKVSFNLEVGGWDQLNRSLKDKELPPVVEEQRVALETAAKDSLALKSKHRRLRADTLVASRRLREAVERGRQAESRLRSYLKAEYGATNPLLLQHGIKPRRRGRFREDSDAALAPSPTEEAASSEAAAGALAAQEAPATSPAPTGSRPPRARAGRRRAGGRR